MAQLALLMSQMVNQQEAREERRLRLEEQKMELEIRRIDNEGARGADRVAAPERQKHEHGKESWSAC